MKTTPLLRFHALKRIFSAILLSSIATTGTSAKVHPCSFVRSGEYRIDTNPFGDDGRKILPYVNCMINTEYRYLQNNGPFAVQQCASTKVEIIKSFGKMSKAKRRDLSALLNEAEDRHVWVDWCNTDTSRSLPPEIKIRAGWPQYKAEANAPNK